MCRVKPSAHPRDRDHRSLKLKSQSTLVSTLNLKKSESVPYVNVYLNSSRIKCIVDTSDELNSWGLQ